MADLNYLKEIEWLRAQLEAVTRERDEAWAKLEQRDFCAVKPSTRG